MEIDHRQRRFEIILGSCFAFVFLLLGLAPLNRGDWAVENLLVGGLLLALALGYRRFRFSPASLLLICLFLCLHEVGAHYTYAKVPYDAWFEALSGHGLSALGGWQRNQFDRFVHLSYGLLFAYPAREFAERVMGVRGLWGRTLALQFILASSALYELTEWVGGDLLGGVQPHAFVGAQGDFWDSQKDMALAAFGGLVTLALVRQRQPQVRQARHPRRA
jgi:putative membrane protein